MRVFALFTWFVTVFAGLYLLAIWLIEYDIGAPGRAGCRGQPAGSRLTRRSSSSRRCLLSSPPP
jgi:hypothetical protein